MVNPESSAIRVEGLVKGFGGRPVLANLNIDIARGEFLVLFGPNGSGKTTFLRTLATLIQPDQGRIWVEGFDLSHSRAAIKRLLGVVGHRDLLYRDLTAHENLFFYGRMFSVPQIEDQIQKVLHLVKLEGQQHHRVYSFSNGMLKRLSLARALIHDPSVLLLDEPESGLDPEALSKLHEVLTLSKKKGCTIVMTTHNIEQGLFLGDRIAILARGSIAFDQAKTHLDPEAFPELYTRYAERAQ